MSRDLRDGGLQAGGLYGSVAGSVQGDNGAPDAAAGGERKRLRAWYVNMLFINLVELGSEGARGLVLGSMFMFQMRLGGSMSFMCYVIASFSAGRVISSTALGFMCDKFGCRMTYIVALLISASGNMLYAFSDKNGLDSRYALLLARFIVGFGAGNRTVCRADVAQMTTAGQRLRWMTVLSATIFAGYALTPGFGTALATLDFQFLGFKWNEYNTPGAILALYNVVVFALAITAYDSSITTADGPADLAQTPQNECAEEKSIPAATPELPRHTIAMGIWLCVLLNFVSRGILAVLEITTTPIYLSATGTPINSPTAVSKASFFQLLMGIVGLGSFVFIDRSKKCIAEMHLLAFAFACTAVGCAMLVPNLSTLGLPRFVIADLFAWSIGSPISGAVVIVSFSKIIGKQKQGKHMGYIGSAGSLARIIMPMILSVLPGSRPFETEFAMLAILAGICCFAAYWYFKVVRKQCEQARGWQLSEQAVLGKSLL
jgi:ceroid-lipofuscinosis MFS transporter 7